MDQKTIGDFLHATAEPIRMINPGMADALHYVAANIHRIEDTFRAPFVVECEECEGDMRLVDKFCPRSEDYRRGYRGIYRCVNPDCGEMIVR